MFTSLIKSFAGCWKFIRRKGLRQTMLSRDVPALIQFGKYGFCGCIALLLHSVIVYSLGLTVNPAIGDYIPRELKETNAMWNNGFAFFPSNIAAYLLNAAFVFTPGRHSKRKEIILFFFISALSFSAGQLTIWAIFRSTDTCYDPASYQENIEYLVNFGFIISSVLVNFVCRKFIVFQR